MERLRNTEKKLVRFVAVASVPCFELWLLLHYVNQQAFCDRHEMLRKVREHIPAYDKGVLGIFARTEASIQVAINRAEGLRARYAPHSGCDPYTDMDLLVARLLSLRSA
jgi:hypothetical protein